MSKSVLQEVLSRPIGMDELGNESKSGLVDSNFQYIPHARCNVIKISLLRVHICGPAVDVILSCKMSSKVDMCFPMDVVISQTKEVMNLNRRTSKKSSWRVVHHEH